MARPLLLTALFCAVAVQIEVNAVHRGCGWTLSYCENYEGCFDDSTRCDGNKDCKDGSDEDGCDEAVASMNLPVNSTVTASIQYLDNWPGYNSIEVLLCSNTLCGKVVILGTEDYEGTFFVAAFSGCKLYGRDCRNYESRTRGYSSDLLNGVYNITIQRRPSELAVWRKGQPEVVWTIPTEADQNTLLVRPEKMFADMPVEFTVE